MSGSSPSKHASFYIDTVTFRIEDCLFKVPRKPFEKESIVFRDMFLLPPGDDREEEGKSDDNPIHLLKIKKEEFEQLLSVLLHRTNGTSQDPLPETAAQWESVLKLSNMWGFHTAYKRAVENLRSKLMPVEKIALGELYNLDFESWLLPAMQDLVRRQEPISFEEGLKLGLETVVKLASVREQISYPIQTTEQPSFGSSKGSGRSYTVSPVPVVGRRADVKNLDFTKALRETFKTS